MLLAIDVGNSNTSVGVFADTELRCELRLSTRHSWTADEVAIYLERGLSLRKLSFADLTSAVIACVVPPAQPSWLQALKRYAQLDPLVVGPGIRTGMPIRYEPPQDVGADRIVTAVAAYERYKIKFTEGGSVAPQAIIVVDFGTATTFDVITAKPEYLGGAIAPGIGIAADALFARAAKLPRVEIVRPEQVIGRNTVAAMQSGLVHGYVGLVEGLIQRIQTELALPTFVVGTGGFSSLIAQESTCIDIVDDALVLEGLRILYERNRDKSSQRTTTKL